MANLNRVFIIGNVTRDPEIRYTPRGTPVCDIGLAINRIVPGSDEGERTQETVFVDVVLWARLAEIAGQYLQKGNSAFIEGRLQLDTWTESSGQKRSRLREVAESLQMLGRPESGATRRSVGLSSSWASTIGLRGRAPGGSFLIATERRFLLNLRDGAVVLANWTNRAKMYPVLKIYNQPTFENADLSEFDFAISIQAKDSSPAVLRPDFRGQRLNLYFDDVLEGQPGAATPADIDALFDFAQAWLSVARSEPASASLVTHCAAGVSRSAASVLLPLTLYFGNYLAAAVHLFRNAPYVLPNAWICRLIFQKLGSAYGTDIFEALGKGKEEASRAQ